VGTVVWPDISEGAGTADLKEKPAESKYKFEELLAYLRRTRPAARATWLAGGRCSRKRPASNATNTARKVRALAPTSPRFPAASSGRHARIAAAALEDHQRPVLRSGDRH
jgi:hypothetical protein